MKIKENNFVRPSPLQITVPVTLISLSAVLLTLGAAPARHQFEPLGTSARLQNPQHRAALSESSAAAKQTNPRKSADVKLSRRQDRGASAGPGWVTTGSMHYARFFHTATLLQSGEVLVTGDDVAVRSYMIRRQERGQRPAV